MGVVYHGSKNHGIKRLEPRKSTHGEYLYATHDKVLALIFSRKSGDDLTFDVGHFGIDKDAPWQLVENIPGAFDKMFSNSSSIYTFSDETFKDINTGFDEVVSSVGADVISEEYVDNVFEGIKKAQEAGLVTIYRYPNKPEGLKQDGSDILDKWKYYKENLNKDFEKREFDRLAYLHPELLDKINILSKDLGYDYYYTPGDLISLFKKACDIQLRDSEHELYVDSSYISIVNNFPEIREIIDETYEYYKERLEVSKAK